MYVARYNADKIGRWIPLLLTTATNPIPPSVISSQEGNVLDEKVKFLPLLRRNGVAGQTEDGGMFKCDRTNEATALPDYQNKKLSDFYPSKALFSVMLS